MSALEIIELVAVGLAAGVLGGLAGVGGSILILPALGLIFGYPDPNGTHHVYMAAAMTTNVVVAIPAALRHWRAGAVRTDLLPRLVPATALALALGVWLSNFIPGWWLVLGLAAFLLCYCAWMLWQVHHRLPEPAPSDERASTGRLVVSSGFTGVTAGLLGLGGGGIQVPLLQLLCKLPLRPAIATSSAVICLTALVGAALKLWGLEHLAGSGSQQRALLLALAMAPGAVIGALVGAQLTHKLPLNAVRVAMAALIGVSALALAYRGGRAAGWW
jgi:uncharacterized membrane protein YfcA